MDQFNKLANVLGNQKKDELDEDYIEFGRLCYYFGIDFLKYIDRLTAKQVASLLKGARKEGSMNAVYAAKGAAIVNSKNPQREFKKLIKEVESGN